MNEREREALSKAGQLNSYLAVSSIPEAALAARQRAEAQRQYKLQQRKRQYDTADTALALGMEYGNGRFQGTGMEAQMLNIWNNPNISMNDPRKQQARAYLSRPTVTNMGDGTSSVRQGILGGNETTTVKPTDAQIAARNAVAISDANAEVTPGAGSVEANWWDATAAQIPFLEESFYQSEDWKNQQVAAEAWTETYAKTVKGGGQVTDDDRKQVRQTYWPTESDDPEQIEIKAKYRRNVEDQARKQAAGRNPGNSENLSVDDLLQIY